MIKNIEFRKPSFILIIILLGFPQLHEAMFAPSLQTIALNFDISIASAQSTLSIYFVAFAIGVLFWGFFSDKFGRRPALLWGFVIYCLGTVVMLTSSSFNFFLVGRFVVAFGLATGSVTTQTILRESFDTQIRSKLFSQVSIALAIVPGIGPLLGGYLIESYSLRLLLVVFLVCGLSIVALTYLRLPETNVVATTRNANFFDVLMRMLRSKRVWMYGFFIASMNVIMSIYYLEAPLLFPKWFGISLATTGSLGISLAIATILGATIAQLLLRNHAPKQVLQFGNYILILGAILMFFFGYTATNTLLSLILYMGGMFFVRVGTAISLSNAISLALEDFQDVYGTAGSILSLGYYLAISVLLHIMSVIHTGSLLVMPLYFIILALLMIAMTAMSARND